MMHILIQVQAHIPIHPSFLVSDDPTILLKGVYKCLSGIECSEPDPYHSYTSQLIFPFNCGSPLFVLTRCGVYLLSTFVIECGILVAREGGHTDDLLAERTAHPPRKRTLQELPTGETVVPGVVARTGWYSFGFQPLRVDVIWRCTAKAPMPS